MINPNKSIVLGIDLGTSNTQAAYIRISDGKPIIVKSANSTSEFGKAFPTYIYKDPSTGVYTFGEEAKQNSLLWGYDNCAREFKKIIGRSDDNNKELKLKFADEELSGVDLSAKFLRYVKDEAEKQSGQVVTECVITVPAAFDNSRREATKNAAAIAGLNVLGIINEPTAASLAYYDLEQDEEKKKIKRNIAIFDIGGGTFDFTIASMEDSSVEVVASDGDLALGGTYMDSQLVEYLERDIKKTLGVTLVQGSKEKQELLKEIEKVKIELSTITESRLMINKIGVDSKGDNIGYVKKIERRGFERIVSNLISRINAPIQQCLSQAKLNYSDIDKVVLVGGPSRIPAIISKVKDLFGSEKIANTLNPMECVAIGAAIQGSIKLGGHGDLLLVDIVPLTIGIGISGGVVQKMLKKGQTLPCKKTMTFTNEEKMGPNIKRNKIEISAYQGERIRTVDNTLLGKVYLESLPPSPARELEIEVTFKIDRNGILQIEAEEKRAKKKVSITIKNCTNLSDEEIELKMKDFEENAEKDKLLSQTSSIVEKIKNNLEELEGFKEEKEFFLSNSVEREDLNQYLDKIFNEYLKIPLEDLLDKKGELEKIEEETNTRIDKLIGLIEEFKKSKESEKSSEKPETEEKVSNEEDVSNEEGAEGKTDNQEQPSTEEEEGFKVEEEPSEEQ